MKERRREYGQGVMKLSLHQKQRRKDSTWSNGVHWIEIPTTQRTWSYKVQYKTASSNRALKFLFLTKFSYSILDEMLFFKFFFLIFSHMLT